MLGDHLPPDDTDTGVRNRGLRGFILPKERDLESVPPMHGGYWTKARIWVAFTACMAASRDEERFLDVFLFCKENLSDYYFSKLCDMLNSQRGVQV